MSFREEQVSGFLLAFPFETNREMYNFLNNQRSDDIGNQELEKEVLSLWADKLIQPVFFTDLNAAQVFPPMGIRVSTFRYSNDGCSG